jgi:hypothetical protein
MKTESGPQAIPVSEVLAYASYFHLPRGLRSDLLHIVTLLDEAFLNHAFKRRRESEEKARREAKRKRPAVSRRRR